MGVTKTDKLTVQLDWEDLQLLVRSSAPLRFELTDRLQVQGLGARYHQTRFSGQGWVWNHRALAGLSTPQLWDLYQQLKQDRVI